MNIDIVSRVRAAESGDLPANLLIDKFNTVKCGRLPFTFSHLHTAEAGVCEIFSKSVEPLLDLCITGFNTSLLVVGESDAGREKLLMGDDNVRNGLLPILFAGLFAKIGDDDTYGSGRRPGDGTLLNRVQMQMVEIRGEDIIDLFRSPENTQPLHITETADSGVKIDVGRLCI
ncbi:hypothetical protein NP493_2g13202 [Ridgeia piscesae]|uniref:Kinesin motor domain-containing protein n=1 Tax=Ridgeia piscesae TaxID=27915 RepID=A0AAD9PGB9_RIDPI|nr:hypothetical protein NP493_2g13202 [Ridgeia piscesae]